MQKIPRLTRWICAIALLFLLLMTVMRLLAWWNFRPPGSGITQSANVFWLGFRYDAREAAIISLLLFLLSCIPSLHPFKSKLGKSVQFILLSIAFIALIIFYVFDFLHFRYLQQRLNASALSFLEDAKISGAMVWQTYPVVRILLGMVIAFIVLYWIAKRIYRSIEKKVYTGNKLNRIAVSILLFLICALGIFGRVGQYPLRWSDAFDLGSDFQANLALNPFQSFFSSLSFRSSTYNLSSVKKYYPFVSSYLAVNRPDSSSLNYERTFHAVDSIVLHPPNIVLVICESFSAYKSSMWGNPLNTTPYFNELCKQGLFFDNCFTPAYGTARGVWAAVTGVPDVEFNKTASRNPAMVDQHTIINDFTGYDKFYFLGGSTSWANMRGLLTNNIKDLHLYEEQDYQSPKIDVWGISDKNLFKEANGVLKKQNKPFIAVIQTADNHRPYTIPSEDLATFKKVNVATDSLKKYGFDSNDELNAFRFTDYCYESFIEAAKKEQYFGNTIFMFIGDHGIGGNANAMMPRAWSDNGLTQYHVPLLIYSPKKIVPRRLHCVASQVDVLPTLAGLAGIAYRNNGFGRDLVQQYKIDSGANNIAFIFDPNIKDVGIIKGPWYFTRNQQGSQEKMLWIDFNRSTAAGEKDALMDSYRNYTSGFFETARWLLKNNKKRSGQEINH